MNAELPAPQVLHQLFSAIEQTQDGLALFCGDDKLQYCNQTFAALFAHAVNDAVGKSFDDIMRYCFDNKIGLNIETDNIDDWLEKAHKKRRRYKFRRFETDFIDHRWFMITEQRLDNGSLLIYASDITGHINTENKLKRVSKNLYQLATLDSLTHIYNRRHFYHMANIELERCYRNQNPVALLMVDLDFFKKINDRYGHAAGDQVLIKFTQEMSENLRSYDVFGRIGGEEFAALLPKTDLHTAVHIAERIRQQIAEMKVVFNQHVIKLTVSIGISLINEQQLELEQLIAEADAYLYKAKVHGRNTIEACPETIHLQQKP
ncbi:MAG: diguanylate cyclase [Pseudomonadales bacterium]|nr:diguanylate cyclase [Pseudomonadales bacterium]